MRDGSNPDLTTTPSPPNIVKISIYAPQILSAIVTHDQPDLISYKLTDKRTYTFNNNSVNVTTPFTGMTIDNFLKEKAGLNDYQDFNDFQIGANVISFTPSTNTLVVGRETNTGYLTENSSLEPIVEFRNNSIVHDEYRFRLIRSPNFTFDNQIVNPVLVGIASPYDAIKREIILKIKKGTNATNYILLDSTAVTTDRGYLTRTNGSTTADTIEQKIAISVTTPDYHESSSFEHLMDGTSSATQLTIASNNTTSSPNNGDKVMALLINRYPRYGLNYQINYSQATRKDQGIYDEYEHAVLQNSTYPVINDMQNIIVNNKSTFNVIYPASKPSSFAGTPVSTGSSTDPNNSYEDYPVYYEASLTFKNQQTNNPVKLTARYNYETPPGGGGEYELQKKGGHNLKHGMLLVYGTDEINENTTQTTIRNGNTVVDLIDSKYGEKLVIKFIPGIDSKFAYDSTSSNEKPTFYFKDISVTAGIDFGDREKKNLTGGSLSPPAHYYTNLLTNDGNVVPPFDTALLYDSNYTQDTDGNTPDISGNPVLKATYTPLSGGAAFWTKTVELGFNQDIYDELTSVGLNISKGTSSYPYTSSVTNDKITLTMNNLDDVTTQDVTANNISAVYNNPTAETGSYPFTNKLYNWFGFEIGSFNSQLVNDSNLESLPTITFGNIGGTLSDFSVADSQLFENNYSGNLAWYVSNNASFSNFPNNGGHRFKYYIQISEEDSATGSFSTWTNFGPSVGGTTSYELSTTITGLNYNKYYKFRVRGKSYDFGEWTVISDIHTIETITPYAASNKNATPSAPIAKFEWTTPDTSIDTYKIQLTKKFYSSGDPDFTDLSGTILLTNQSGTTTNFSLNATDFTTSGGTGYFNPDDEFQSRIIGTKDDSSPYTGYHWVSQDDAVTIHDASSNILSFRAHKDDRLYNAIDISFTHVNDINDYTVNFYTESAGTYTKIGSRDFSQTGPTQHDNIDTNFTVGSTTVQVLDKLEDSNGLASGGQTIYATIVSKYSIGSRAWEEPEFDSTSNNFGTFTPDSSSLIGTVTGKGVNYTTSPTLSIRYSSGVPQDISANLKSIVDADIYELRIANNSGYLNTGGTGVGNRSNVTENSSTSFNAADWSSPGAGGTTISLEYNKVYYGKYKAGLSSLLTNKFDNFGLRESSDTLLLSKPNIPGNPSSGGTAFNFSATVDNVNSSTQYNDVTVQFDSANDGNNIDKTNNNFKYVLQYGVVSTTATEVDLTPTSGTSYSYSITDLSDNTNYFFKLITRNSTTGLSGTSGTVYGGGDSLAVSASNVSIKSRPITASIDSWKIYEKESGLYTELNKSVAIIDEYVRFNFTTDMDLTTIAVTKVEVTDDSGTATTVSTSSGPNSIPFIITTNIDTTTNRSGYIQLKINPFNEDGFVTFTFNLTNSNSVVAAYTANSNLTTGAITIDSSRPDVQSTSKEWIVKVHNSGSWVAKSNTNGVGNDIKKAFVGEMLELSFTTDDDDLSGNSIPEGIYDVSVNLTENPEIAAPTYILAASQLSSFNTSYIDISYNLAKDGGKIGYIVQDGDYGSVQFKFNLRDENGNIIATKENILSYNSSLSSGLTQYGAYNIDYPNDNNITFDVSLNLSEKFGDVDFILDYNPPKLGTISFRDRATVTDISFCSAVDVSFNSTLNDYIIDSKNTDYVLYAPLISTSGNATVFSGTGEFDKTS